MFSNNLSSRLLAISSIIFTWLFSLSKWILILVILSPSFWIFLLVLLYVFYFFEGIFHPFHSFCECLLLLEHFRSSFFWKSLSDKFIICVISVLASVVLYVELFLILHVSNYFRLYPGQFKYYIVKLSRLNPMVNVDTLF